MIDHRQMIAGKQATMYERFSQCAHLAITYRPSGTVPGRVDAVCEWQGDPRLPVLMPHSAKIDEMPWPLRRLGPAPHPSYGASIYVRTDAASRLTVWLFARRYALRRLADTARARLIFTAHIWGLACVPFGEEPCWRHLRKKGTPAHA